MQNKVKIFNSNENWNEKKRYKINTVVKYLGVVYQNSTGSNSEPSILLDWVIVKKDDVTPTSYFQEFIDDGSHQYVVPEGIRVQNAFLNGAQVTPFTQVGTLITTSNSITDDLVTLTGSN